jgi:REP element-mobilizing transposase RayT
MENNNIKTFRICFFDIIRDNIHYLVTTDPNNDLYELITIRYVIDNENVIISNDHQLQIYYNNHLITTSNQMKLSEIENLLKITAKEFVLYSGIHRNVWRTEKTTH